MDQLVLDQLPDDAGHLVAVEFDDGAFDLDFLHEDDLASEKLDGDRIRTILISNGATMKRAFDAVVCGSSPDDSTPHGVRSKAGQKPFICLARQTDSRCRTRVRLYYDVTL
jgi:hypothetical protein